MTQIVIGQGKSEMGTPDIIKGEILRNGVDAAPLRRPSHVGVIMDGNGRWAASHGLPRFEGHRRGVEALRQTVRAAIDFGLDYLTVYSFSVENWTRPVEEISDLMGLLKRFIQNDLHELQRAGVKIKVIGIRETLKPDIRNLLEQAETLTKNNTKLNLLIAFNYGSRQEIVAAARAIAEKVASGQLKPENIDESLFVQYLDTAGVPDPDLIIRTSGEQRLSNFLMWQAAYAEFVFLPIYWPDFDRKAFESALDQYAVRERRFGGVAEHVAKAAIGS